MARWFMQPVTASVPASARALASARAVAACSTSATASSTSAGVNGSDLAPDEHHDGLDLAAVGKREQHRAGDVTRFGEAWDARLETLQVGGEKAVVRAGDPANAGRALGARVQVADPSGATVQVHGDELLVRLGVGREVVDVNLLCARYRHQLARKRAKHALCIRCAVGQRGQPPDAAEQPVEPQRLRRGIRTRYDVHTHNVRHANGPQARNAMGRPMAAPLSSWCCESPSGGTSRPWRRSTPDRPSVSA